MQRCCSCARCGFHGVYGYNRSSSWQFNTNNVALPHHNPSALFVLTVPNTCVPCELKPALPPSLLLLRCELMVMVVDLSLSTWLATL